MRCRPLLILSVVATALFLGPACSAESDDDGAGASDTHAAVEVAASDSGAADSTVAPDTATDLGTPDVPQPDTTPDVPEPDVALDVPEPDVAPDVPEPDVAPDVPEPDVAPDVPEPDVPPVDAASLLIEDQTLPAPFDEVLVKVAAMPDGALATGRLRLRFVGGPNDGVEAASKLMSVGAVYEDLVVDLYAPVVATQDFVADILDSNETPFPDVDGSPLERTFTVTGDDGNPELVAESQLIDPSDFYGLVISRVVVPDRFPAGVWVAVYTDDGSGAPGQLRGKQKYLPGEYLDSPFHSTNKFVKAHDLHAIMRMGHPGSGSWNQNGAIIQNLSGFDVTAQFHADSVAFRPALEIEDQALVEPDEIQIKLVTIPQEFIGGGWVAIYADDAGAPGAFLGNQYFTQGTKTDKVVTLDTDLEGDQTLHAKLHGGQLWDDAINNVMQAQGGGELIISFNIGAQSLSYIDSPPYTTDDPRHVVVNRAYSFHKPAWVVLARDEGGVPGTIIAKKKVLHKFAGNVHFDSNVGDFEDSGSAEEYLTGQPGTYRRCARGVDLLHVLLYEEDPADGEFTYTPGGTEDLPVLDSNLDPVTSLFTVTVASSIQNVQKDSPRYYNPCPLSQQINNPTTLPVDCRCHVDVVSLAFPECKSTIADALDMTFGDGPRARGLSFGHWRSGFVESATNELIALVVFKDHETVWPENGTTIDVGAVMAIDMDTRDRRLIGGRYKHDTGLEDHGTGPVLSYPFQVQKGPDGMYYIASYSYVRIDASLTPGVDIIKMDPATGDREYVWRSNHLGFNEDNVVNPYGHCGNGRTELFGYYSVQIGRKAFGIGEDGKFYLSYAHNGDTPTSNGVGILEIAADGSTCDFVTRTGTGIDNVLYQGVDIGDGPVPQAGPYKGMLVKDGKLYTSTGLTDDLYEIDIATGDRTAIHVYGVTDQNTGSSGTHVVWDPHRELIWQAGFASSTLLYDPATGGSEPLWCPQNYRDYKGIACLKLAAWGNNGLLLERGFWIHPTNPNYAFVVNGTMIQRVDLAAGTSEIFSY